MQIDDFLKTYVEGYLFHDLNSMAAIELPAGQKDGAAGYPLLMATISGINLLGTLLFPSPPTDMLDSGSTYFMYYWQQYLEKTRRFTVARKRTV